MKRNNIYYWDSDVFIAWITGESTRSMEEKLGIISIIKEVDENKSILIASVISHAEVFKDKENIYQEVIDKFEGVFKRPANILIEVNSHIAKLARDLRTHVTHRAFFC